MTAQEIQNIIQNISAMGLIALFILIVIKPLMPLLVQRLQNRTNNNGINKLKDRLDSLEHNHMSDVLRRIENLERKQDEFSKELENIKIELVKLKTKL